MSDRPPTTLSTTDIVQLLLADHRDAGELLGRLDGLPPDERASYFSTVVSELVAHEVAEEHVVYPIIHHTPGGEAEMKARIGEEAAVEKMLVALGRVDATSPEFATRFAAMREAVLDHARAEEATTFPILVEFEDDESRIALGGRYKHAKGVAPTHAHPHAPHSPPGNIVLDPVAAFFDRARNAVKGT